MMREPPAICCFTSVEDVYGYEPVPVALSEEEAKHVLGRKAMYGRIYPCLQKVEYMATPEQQHYLKYLVESNTKRLVQLLGSPTTSFERLDHRGLTTLLTMKGIKTSRISLEKYSKGKG